jgi:hypothetical protein
MRIKHGILRPVEYKTLFPAFTVSTGTALTSTSTPHALLGPDVDGVHMSECGIKALSKICPVSLSKTLSRIFPYLP